jgi:hypothetical protein
VLLAGDDDNGGPGTATPEELEFEDDDGTIYVWDKVLRKYMPKVGICEAISPHHSLRSLAQWLTVLTACTRRGDLHRMGLQAQQMIPGMTLS